MKNKNRYYLQEEYHLDIEEEKEEIENLTTSEVQQEALRLLRTFLKKPVKWNNMFSLIEKVRREMQSGRDNYDSSANDTQLSLITPLLVFFSLTIKTSMQMQPIDSEIIINILADNFKSQEHLDELGIMIDEIYWKYFERFFCKTTYLF